MIDIGEVGKYPGENLSNFNQMSFIIDGVECTSMEGFLQSLKFQDTEKQKEICSLWGGNAKKKGSKKNKVWKRSQKLNWLGTEYDRDSLEYDLLIEKAYNEMFKNELYKNYILHTGLNKLIHSYGRNDKKETVLTEEEFCNQIYRLRNIARSEKIKELEEKLTKKQILSSKNNNILLNTINKLDYIPDNIIYSDESFIINYKKTDENWLKIHFYEKEKDLVIKNEQKEGMSDIELGNINNIIINFFENYK